MGSYPFARVLPPRTVRGLHNLLAALFVAVILHGSIVESWQDTSSRMSEITVQDEDLVDSGLHERMKRAAVLNRTAVEVSPLAVSVNLVSFPSQVLTWKIMSKVLLLFYRT